MYVRNNTNLFTKINVNFNVNTRNKDNLAVLYASNKIPCDADVLKLTINKLKNLFKTAYDKISGYLDNKEDKD